MCDWFTGRMSTWATSIDQHIKGFKALGAEIDESSTTSMKIEAKELKGAHIFLDMVSVGATINIMLAAVYATGQTVMKMLLKNRK